MNDLDYLNKPYSQNYPSIFNPICIEREFIKIDEYKQGEDFADYLPIKFDLLSIVINSIGKFQNFSESDWQEFGYKMPLRETFDNTKSFLCSIPDRHLFILETENIEPTPYGTFVLDFISQSGRVSIEIGKDKLGFFTDFLSLNNYKSEGIYFNGNEIPKEIAKAFEELL